MRVRATLEKSGCSVWSDARIRPGERWARAIERAIDKSDTVVALIGSHCLFCDSEILRATRKGKRIVPVLLWNGAEIPLLLEPFQRVQLDRIAELCR